MVIRCLIADDDERTVDMLRMYLEERQDIHVAGVAYNGIEAVQKIRDLEPDLVFMDIEMPGLNGLEAVNQLEKNAELPLVIFVTAHEKYATSGYSNNNVAYIIKPYDQAQVFETVDELAVRIPARRIYERQRKNGGQPGPGEGGKDYNVRDNDLAIRTKGSTSRFHPCDIIAFHTDNEKLFMKLENGETLQVVGRMSEIMGQLTDYLFIRTHKRYLVNATRVKEVFPAGTRSYRIRMGDPDKTEVPISKFYLRQAGGIKRLCEKFGCLLLPK